MKRSCMNGMLLLDVFEAVNKETPFADLRWAIDHAETISPRNMDRVKALGGGIAVQSRLAYAGKDFKKRYPQQAASAPPIREMLKRGIPVGAGTDGTRVASYNPWISLYWLVTGKTVGGTQLASVDNRLSREEALRLYTIGSAWFSGEETLKGRIAPGQYADVAVLSADYFAVPEEEIKRKLQQLPGPVMCPRTGLDTDEAQRKIGEPFQYLPPRQLLA